VTLHPVLKIANLDMTKNRMNKVMLVVYRGAMNLRGHPKKILIFLPTSKILIE
jgi:hypothetical protein